MPFGFGADSGPGGIGGTPYAEFDAGLAGTIAGVEEQKRQFDISQGNRKQLLALLGLTGNDSNSIFGQIKGSNLSGLFNDLGKGRRQQINQAFNDQAGSTLAGLEDRGLASSNILPTALQGNERERQFALTDLADTVAQTKIGAVQTQQSQLISLLNSLLGSL